MSTVDTGRSITSRARSRAWWALPIVVLVAQAACLLDRGGTFVGDGGEGGPPPDADVVGGGDGDADRDADDGGPDAELADADPADSCVPSSCEALSRECGRWPDPCLGELDCGVCTTGGCHDGRCVGVIFVKADATGRETGLSWADAFTSVQQAVDAAAAGTEIWVAAGLYRAAVADPAVVTMVPGTVLYGGFAGTELDLGERHLGAGAESTLDGEDLKPVVFGASDARLDGFTIRNGYSSGHGGGLFLVGDTGFVLASSRVHHNRAQSFGGGLFLTTGSSATIVGCVFEGNEASHGGAIFSELSSLDLDGSQFRGNSVISTTGGGGAIDNHYSPSTIRNCLFVANRANPYFGGAIYNLGAEAHAVIRHTTFSNNSASHNGGAIFNNLGGSNDIANCIFWGNVPDSMFDYGGDARSTVRYTVMQGSWPGEGVLTVDPLFVDAAAGDLRLGAGSPCIDAADGAYATELDMVGAARVDDPAVPNTGIGEPDFADLGALERQGD